MATGRDRAFETEPDCIQQAGVSQPRCGVAAPAGTGINKAKVKIIKKLEQIRQLPTFKETEDGYEVTGEEGFVAVDKVGNALKLVDRLEFSKLNFGTGKPGA